MAKKRHKNNLMSKAINKEHKLASPTVTRGSLKRKCFNELPEKNVSKEISNFRSSTFKVLSFKSNYSS